jgi:alkylation response protein AidB-like acyl-CoA dehydrogenase
LRQALLFVNKKKIFLSSLTPSSHAPKLPENRGNGMDQATKATPLARAQLLAPLVAEAADRIEAGRELPPDLLDALHDAALFRTLLPRAFGGDEARLSEHVQVLEAIAAADASTAWCLGQAAGCAMAAAYLAPEAAQQVWGDRRAVLAWGQAGPDARAEPVAGGFRVSGHWNFASGGRHATWFGGHCKLAQPEGPPLEWTMLIPAAQASLTDAWQVLGLRGTGSDTYAVHDLFVPTAFALRRDVPELRRQHGTLYQFSTTHAYASGFAGVALGIARAMLTAFLGLAGSKTPGGSSRALRDSPLLQRDIAVAEARLRAARTLLLTTLDEAWEHVAAGGALDVDRRMSIRLASTYATQQAREVVDMCWQEAGATAIFQSGPFERRFRDMHSVTQQVQARSSHFETVGQHLLGLQPPLRFV